MYDKDINEDVRKDDHHRQIIIDSDDITIDDEDNIEESRIDTFRYYHLSKYSDIDVLKPSISDNFMTQNGYEENKTPRVCFAPSIDQCLMAMSANIADEEFYVYTPYNIDVNKLYKPSIKEVPDSAITGEVWSTKPIKVKCIGKIKVGDSKDISHSYKYGNNNTAELYEWEYKLLFNESDLYSVYGNYDYINEITQESLKKNKYLKPVFVVTTYTSTFLGSMIKNWLDVDYSHALISLDPYLRTMYTYDAGGLIIDDIHRYMYELKGSTMAVMCILVTPKMHDSIRQDLEYYVKNKDKTHYNLLALVRWLKGSNKQSSFGDLWMMCSEFVDSILKHNMIDLSGSSSANVHPSTFGKYKVRNNVFLVYKGYCANYDGKQTEKYIERLKRDTEFEDLFVMTPNSMKSQDDIILGKKNHIGEFLSGGVKYTSSQMASKLPSLNLRKLATAESYIFTEEEIVDGGKPIYDPNTLSTSNTKLLDLPNDDWFKPDLLDVLNRTPDDHIYCTSDWHFFKNHYKKEHNYVNTQKIVKWCIDNIKDDDVFLYLGDISYIYANGEDQLKSQKIMSKIPGIKILVLGNHDKMLGIEYFTKCGFDYVVDQIEYRNIIFTHKPIRMDVYGEDKINIHGHIHTDRIYKTTDGSRNVNVYPYWFNNKPVTLDYLINNWKDLVKDNKWLPNYGYGENTIRPYHDNPYNVAVLEATNRLINRPTVYYSNQVNSKIIVYMVALFGDRIGVNTAIKLHFGEPGNENFLNPKLLKDLVKNTNAALVDSNTAYKGSHRGNTVDHINTARNNGFDFAHIDILDADGDIKVSVPQKYQIQNELRELYNGKPGYKSPLTKGRHLNEISLGSHITNYDSLIVYTHFKGHEIAGYGGAVKNIGMGIPSAKHGKMEIHDTTWEKGPIFLERLVESAAAIQSLFYNKIVYVNVLQNMSTACDCDAHAPKATIPNIGVVVSDDILAIEQASLDLIRNTPKNKDLMEVIGNKSGYHQIEYMDWLGMGSKDYILKDIDGDKRIKLESTEPINENILFNKDDLRYNYDKFINGDINLAMVVGFSGGGKSTLGRELSSKIPNAEHCEFDIVVHNWDLSDEVINKSGDLIKSFFNSNDGKKYRIKNRKVWQTYHTEIVEAFVDYCVKYANKHKNKKFIVEGVWPLIYDHDPVKYKDWCVMIKGTSYLLSTLRTITRAAKNQDSAYHKLVAAFFTVYMIPYHFFSSCVSIDKNINRWYKYFNNYPVQESANNNLNDVKNIINSLDKKEYDYIGGGYWTDSNRVIYRKVEYSNNEPIAFIDVYKLPKGNGYGMIILAVKKSSRGNGVAKRLINSAINGCKNKDIKGFRIKIDSDNAASINMAKSLGFSEIDSDNKNEKAFIYEYIKTESTIINEATLSNYKKIPLNKENINKYKKDYPALKHIRDNNNGYLFIDNDKLVAVVAVETKEDGSKWGTTLEIFNPYKAKGLSYKLLDVATKDLGVQYLSVRKTNKLAIYIYEKYGFKSYKETDSQFFMKYNKNLKESTDMINENILLNRKDIEYNYDKFINGDINYAIIVGFSGSGKSTLGRKLSNSNSFIEHYELDDVIIHWDFSDDDLKEYGDLIYSFFKGPGKKYRITYQYLVDNKIDEDHYEKPLLKDFVNYTKKYANSHKGKKFIIEGIWPLMFNHNPEYYKNWCVMIKGTSYLVSDYRASKRELSDDPNTWFGKVILNFIQAQRPSRLKKVVAQMNKSVDRWYKYFSKISLTESTKRSNLPDSAFGIPEDRKYPLDTEKHVRSAIKLFGHAEESKKKSLAKRIQSAARKYDITIPENTQCYKYLHEAINDIDGYTNTDRLLLVETDDGFINLNMNDISWWYICEAKHPSDVDMDLYYSSLEDCVRIKANDSSKAFENNLYITEYVFISNLSLASYDRQQSEAHHLVNIGEINIYPTGNYEWVNQVPVKIMDDEIHPIKEQSLASINPVQGIARPFIVNTGETLGLMTDIESDKIAMVDDDGVLSVQSTEGINTNEVYEFIGDEAYIERLKYKYKTEAHIDNIYTELTGKRLYTLDQLDFDSNFRKIDKDLLEQKYISEFATLRDQIIKAFGYTPVSSINLESAINNRSVDFLNKYNKLNDISINEDMDGVYFYSSLTHKRSGSVRDISMLTENMIKSIL